MQHKYYVDHLWAFGIGFVRVGVEFRGPGHFRNFSEHPTRLTYEALQRASVVTDAKNPQLVKLTSGTGPILISEGQI